MQRSHTGIDKKINQRYIIR